MKLNLSEIEEKFDVLLQKRAQNNEFRNLKAQSNGIDFYSNDYLGLSRDRAFRNEIVSFFTSTENQNLGATGSRLISGNYKEIETLEKLIANKHQVASALFFQSGYNANLALFSCIASKNDTLIVDELIHRSVHDGCKLSHATKWKFKHNNLGHLENLLKKKKGNCFVAVESLYSMDGDFAPLLEILALTEKYNAALIVDEAHAFAVFGLGKVHELQIQNRVFASVMTYGKGLGCDGASILGSQILKAYLVNFASPFIYTTAPSVLQVLKVTAGYQRLSELQKLQQKLQDNIAFFRSFNFLNNSDKTSPIQSVFFKDTEQLQTVENTLKQMNFNVYAVKRPTVAKGSERLRICLHSFNTYEEIEKLATTIKYLINE